MAVTKELPEIGVGVAGVFCLLAENLRVKSNELTVATAAAVEVIRCSTHRIGSSVSGSNSNDTVQCTRK